MVKVDSVLSFNYTEIPTDVYPSLTLENVHHIHGCAKASRPAEGNDMVLGVNEYWSDEEKDSHTNFNLYKKFVQRIIKKTGTRYKYELGKMSLKYESMKDIQPKPGIFAEPQRNHVFIFGNSLDVTDADILREIILTEGVVTTIFYRNKQQKANQIANLCKILGQDKLLGRVFSIPPTIIFAPQKEMVPWQTM